MQSFSLQKTKILVACLVNIHMDKRGRPPAAEEKNLCSTSQRFIVAGPLSCRVHDTLLIKLSLLFSPVHSNLSQLLKLPFPETQIVSSNRKEIKQIHKNGRFVPHETFERKKSEPAVDGTRSLQSTCLCSRGSRPSVAWALGSHL